MRARNSLQEHANSFGRAADVYAASRPSYPMDAVRWLVPASTGRVLDLGAGTGKLTRVLVDGGYEVVAVDPASEMLDRLREFVPETEALVGTAESIPLSDDSVDAVTVAQAWHWIDPAVAVPEVARVLRPGGTLGLVWNTRDESVDWVRRLGEVMGGTAHFDVRDDGPVVGGPFETLEAWTTRWTQPLSRDGLIDLVRSRSYFITKTPEQQAETLEAVSRLLDEHPDLAGRDRIALPYVTECFRTRLA